MTDSNALDVVIRGLKGALLAHRERRLFDIGNGWDDAAAVDHADRRISIAMNLWEGWADSAAHQWRYYEGVSEDDWPRFAGVVLDSLEHGGEIVDAEVLERFAPRPRKP